MANVLFCSDLHFGHEKIGRFRQPFVTTHDENLNRICHDWNGKVTKRDIIYVLGDACFRKEYLNVFKYLKGKKILVRGNHDSLPIDDYLMYFDEVLGLVKYKEFWLSHAPIHPNELRGKVNLHGHVHFDTVNDPRYFNCCPENLWPIVGSALISLDEVRNLIKEI